MVIDAKYGLPFSHLCPVLPAGQRQPPVEGSQGASPAQSHESAQFTPHLPASHPGKVKAISETTPNPHDKEFIFILRFVMRSF